MSGKAVQVSTLYFHAEILVDKFAMTQQIPLRCSGYEACAAAVFFLFSDSGTIPIVELLSSILHHILHL